MKVHTIESDRYKLVTRLSDREMETEVLATQSHEVFYMALANLFIFTCFSVCPPPCMQTCKPEHKPAKDNNKKSSRPAHPLKKQPHSPSLLSATFPLQSTNLFGLSLKKKEQKQSGGCFFIVSRAMLACCTCCAVWMSRQHVVSVLTVRLTQSGCEDRKSEDIGAGMQLRGEGSITSLIKINDRYSCHSNVCSQFHRDDAMGWNRNDHHASVRTRAEHCKN